MLETILKNQNLEEEFKKNANFMELNNLGKLLNKRNIKFKRNIILGGKQILIRQYKGKCFSIVLHPYSYGHENNHLEMLVDEEQIYHFNTGEEAFNKIITLTKNN